MSFSQDYWDQTFTVEAPASGYLDTYYHRYAIDDSLVYIGADNYAGILGYQPTSFLKDNGVVFVYDPEQPDQPLAQLIGSDLTDSTDRVIRYSNFGEAISVSDDYIIITAGGQGTDPYWRELKTYLFEKPVEGWSGVTKESVSVVSNIGVIISSNEFAATSNQHRGRLLIHEHVGFSSTFYLQDDDTWKYVRNDRLDGEYLIVNDTIVLFENDNVEYDDNNNVLFNGYVEVKLFNGTSYEPIDTLKSSWETTGNFGEELELLRVNDTLEYLIIKGDVLFRVYQISSSTDWSAGPNLIFTDSLHAFTYTNDRILAWDPDGNVFFDDREEDELSIIGNYQLTLTDQKFEEGILLNQEWLLEKETYEDSVFGTYFNERLDDLDTLRPNPLAIHDLSDPFNVPDPIPLIHKSAMGLFGFEPVVGMTDSSLFVVDNRIGITHIYRNKAERWTHFSDFTSSETAGLISTSDTLLLAFKDDSLMVYYSTDSWASMINFGFLLEDTVISGYFVNGCLGINYGEGIWLYELNLSAQELNTLATLSSSQKVIFKDLVFDENKLLALTDDDSVYIYTMNLTEAEEDSVVYFDYDLRLPQSTHLLTHLRNNHLVVDRHFNSVTDDFKLVGDQKTQIISLSDSDIPTNVFIDYYDGLVSLTDSLEYRRWHTGRRVALSDNYLTISSPWRTTRRGFKQGVFQIYKRRNNPPPRRKSDSVLTIYEGGHFAIRLDSIYEDEDGGFQRYRFIDSASIDFLRGIPDFSSLYTTWSLLNLPTTTSEVFGSGYFVLELLDSLNKSFKDTLRFEVLPVAQQPTVLQTKSSTIYGDTTELTIQRSQYDGEEVEFFILDSLSQGLLIGADGVLIEKGELVEFANQPIQHVSTEVGTLSIGFSAAVNSDTVTRSATHIVQQSSGQRNLNFTIPDTTRFYGASDPHVNLSFDGFVLGDTEEDIDELPVIVINESFPEAAAGRTFEITISNSGVDNHYQLVMAQSGVLTVVPAPLGVSIKDTSRVFGQPNPEFSAAFEGFVLGEDQSSLSNFALVTEADEASDVGEYIIDIFAQTTNYELLVTTGVLTVRPASQTISFELSEKVFIDSSPYILEAVASSGLPIEYLSSDPSVASVDGSMLALHSIGTIELTATQPGSNNYLPAENVMRTVTVEIGSDPALLSLANQNSNLAIFPNPATRWLTIDIDERLVLSVSLLQIDGQELQISFNDGQIDVSKLRPGAYLLILRLSDQSIITKRLLKR